jgi:hypothetical protein
MTTSRKPKPHAQSPEARTARSKARYARAARTITVTLNKEQAAALARLQRSWKCDAANAVRRAITEAAGSTR